MTCNSCERLGFDLEKRAIAPSFIPRFALVFHGRPGWPRRNFQIQNRRNPARCQATTVSGLTMARAERQSLQMREPDPNQRSAGVNLKPFLAERRSTPIWWRRAKFSSSSAARERNIEEKVPRSVVRKMSIGEELG
jgi:hypothetical protein